MSARNRNSVAGATLYRAESHTSRLRSNSNLSTVDDSEGVSAIVHPVEPRARTAMLPPVLVSPPPQSICCRTAKGMLAITIQRFSLCWGAMN